MEDKNRNSNGSFAKGHKGFKPKGATNIANREVKEKFSQLLDSYPVEQMIQELNNMLNLLYQTCKMVIVLMIIPVRY